MKRLTLIFILCSGLTFTIGSQNPLQPDALSFKALFIDYQSPITGNYGNLRNYKNGLEIAYSRNFNEYFNVAVPLRTAVVSFDDELENDVIASLGGTLQAQLWKQTQPIIPYLLVGASAVYEKNNSDFNFEFPVGLGLDLKIGKNAYFNIQLEYRIGLEDNRDNLQHGVGFKYLIGKVEKTEEPRVPLKPTDSDGDGVPDEIDQCPDVKGPVAFDGCPDTDGDGIPDHLDQCPDFAGLPEFGGCPDTDGDGIPDHEDECPNLAGVPELAGCPVIDIDGDGIIDDEDECPDEPGSRATRGCPDTDGDGIADKDDLCPNLAGLAEFGGCPDTDGDGVHDGIDRCPATPGPAHNHGCPVVKQEVKELLDFAKRAVQFDVGKASLKPESVPVLNQILDILNRNPEYDLIISGHTDSTGDTYRNLDLSEQRAKTCYDFLINRGIDSDRISYIGYGEARPIATNDTTEGKKINRRVEFDIKFK